jgi:hypothetical protein
MVEVLAIAGAVAILAGVSFYGVRGAKSEVVDQKLTSDVAVINRAIGVYLGSGGSLDGVTDAQAVLKKLKTRRTEESALKYAGFTGEFLDRRLMTEPLSGSEVSSNRPRAFWDPQGKRFVIRQSGAEGAIRAFTLASEQASVDFGTEKRKAGTLDLNDQSGWVWKYGDGGTPLKPPAPDVDVDPAKQQLAPPIFAPGAGTYDRSLFPMRVTLSNPNPVGVSEMYFKRPGGSWTRFVTSIEVVDGDTIRAYAKSTSSNWLDSIQVSANYRLRNDRPVATDDRTAVLSGMSDDSWNLLANDTDPNGDRLHLVEVAGEVFAAGKTITLESGAQLQFLDDATVAYETNRAFDDLEIGETARDSFLYLIRDDYNMTDIGEATVIIVGFENKSLGVQSGAFITQGFNVNTLYTLEPDLEGEELMLIEEGTGGYEVNAIGYNIGDDAIYGLAKANGNKRDDLVMIDPATGDMTLLGSIDGLPGDGYYVGDFNDANGYLYVSAGKKRMYQIDINERRVVDSFQPDYDGVRNIMDIAYNRVDNMFYSVGQNGGLLKIHPETGETTLLFHDSVPDGTWGGVMADVNGNLFGVRNQGGIYKFDRETGEATFLLESPETGNNDAALPHDEVAPFVKPYISFKDTEAGTQGLSEVNRYTPVEEGYQIFNDSLQLVDVDTPYMQSAEVRITNATESDFIDIGALAPTLMVDSRRNDDEWILTITGPGTTDDYLSALQGLRLNTNGDNDSRVFEVKMADSDGNEGPKATSVVVFN